VIRITTPPMFALDEIRKRDPDSFEVLDRLFYEFGDHPFYMRAEFRPCDWVELRYLGAVARLFGNEFLVVIDETVH
jgi:hypothetical protein